MDTDEETLKCDCGNEDQTKIVTAPDGEVVCTKCGAVLDQVIQGSEGHHRLTEVCDGETDLCRKILEDRVSKKGWEF